MLNRLSSGWECRKDAGTCQVTVYFLIAKFRLGKSEEGRRALTC